MLCGKCHSMARGRSLMTDAKVGIPVSSLSVCDLEQVG